MNCNPIFVLYGSKEMTGVSWMVINLSWVKRKSCGKFHEICWLIKGEVSSEIKIPRDCQSWFEFPENETYWFWGLWKIVSEFSECLVNGENGPRWGFLFFIVRLLIPFYVDFSPISLFLHWIIYFLSHLSSWISYSQFQWNFFCFKIFFFICFMGFFLYSYYYFFYIEQ